MTRDKWLKIIDIIQWVLIIGLLFVACFIYFGKANYEKQHVIQTEDSYVKIYESQKLAALEKENKTPK
jgi:membrane-bound acyltransferase YfiQ involved in biofilm formation